MRVFIKEYEPSESLRPYVKLYWEGSFIANADGHLSMQMIPKGYLELIILLNNVNCDLLNNNTLSQCPDYIIMGLFTQSYELWFKNHLKVFAIRFNPEGIYNIFGVPASALKEPYGDISMVLGNEFRDFSNSLGEEKSIANIIKSTESHLLKNLEEHNIGTNYLNLAAELIRNSKDIKIKDLPKRIFISQRQLEREFKDKIGISPKHYLKIIRINEVMRLLNNNPGIDLTSVAFHCGYFDQAHFINDFKRITGKTPSIFIKERRRLFGTKNSVL